MQNPELKLAFDFVHYTNRNIFLTGKAGTGKTTFLHKLKDTLFKRMIVVAPTGVAALIKGSTPMARPKIDAFIFSDVKVIAVSFRTLEGSKPS